MHLRRLRCCW